MAAWIPEAAISPTEWLGRRMFGSPSKAAIKSLEDLTSTEAFIDTRVDDDLSLDRLGDPNIAKSAVAELTPLADAEASANKKTFNGWFACRQRDLKYVAVKPSPLNFAEHGIDNPYHAEIVRDNVRASDLQHYLASHLFVAFRFSGQFQQPGARRQPSAPVQSSAPDLVQPKE